MSAPVAAATLVAMIVASHAGRRLVPADPARGRDTAYARVLLRQMLGFLLPALTALALIGATPGFPPAFAALAADLGIAGLIPFGRAAWPLAVGAAVGSVIGVLWERWRWRRSGRRGPLFGEIGWLRPRDRRDLGWGCALALVAGIAEEAYFRFALPLLVSRAGGGAAAGFVAGVAAFGLAHRYQGRAGVIATTLAGMLLAGLYLASGSLWLAMAVHAAIDINSLVLRPAVTGAWRARR